MPFRGFNIQDSKRQEYGTRGAGYGDSGTREFNIQNSRFKGAARMKANHNDCSSINRGESQTVCASRDPSLPHGAGGRHFRNICHYRRASDQVRSRPLNSSFSSAASVTAYDAEGTSLGKVLVTSPKQGWYEFKPVPAGRRYVFAAVP